MSGCKASSHDLYAELLCDPVVAPRPEASMSDFRPSEGLFHLFLHRPPPFHPQAASISSTGGLHFIHRRPVDQYRAARDIDGPFAVLFDRQVGEDRELAHDGDQGGLVDLAPFDQHVAFADAVQSLPEHWARIRGAAPLLLEQRVAFPRPVAPHIRRLSDKSGAGVSSLGREVSSAPGVHASFMSRH